MEKSQDLLTAKIDLIGSQNTLLLSYSFARLHLYASTY